MLARNLPVLLFGHILFLDLLALAYIQAHNLPDVLFDFFFGFALIVRVGLDPTLYHLLLGNLDMQIPIKIYLLARQFSLKLVDVFHRVREPVDEKPSYSARSNRFFD